MNFSTLVYLAAFITLVLGSKCKDGDYSCTDGKCIPQEYVCDGVYDCTDGKDEETCREVIRAALDYPVEPEAPTFNLEFGNVKPIEESPLEFGDLKPTDEKPTTRASDTPAFVDDIEPAHSGARRSF